MLNLNQAARARVKKSPGDTKLPITYDYRVIGFFVSDHRPVFLLASMADGSVISVPMSEIQFRPESL